MTLNLKNLNIENLMDNELDFIHARANLNIFLDLEQKDFFKCPVLLCFVFDIGQEGTESNSDFLLPHIKMVITLCFERAKNLPIG